MRKLMGILSVLASLFGTSCSEKTIYVEFVNARDKSVIAVSNMRPEQLPDSFAVNTTLDIQGRKWAVDSAEPVNKTDFVRSGKLRVMLSPITMMPPGDILFSLPTISDEVGTVSGDALPSEKIFALHEDDWRQVEFVSQSFAAEIDQEFSDIRYIYEHERVKGSGFKKVHIRKRIRAPLAGCQIQLADLEKTLRPKSKFEAVGFQRTRGTIPHSFAWTLDDGLIVWGVTDSNASVAVLCIAGIPEATDVERVSEKLASFTAKEKLALVDWCRATSVAGEQKSFLEHLRTMQ